ncbi:phosphatidylcholine:ceramide cholinephosphotransferase 2-like, partial [Menidia menidia]
RRPAPLPLPLLPPPTPPPLPPRLVNGGPAHIATATGGGDEPGRLKQLVQSLSGRLQRRCDYQKIGATATASTSPATASTATLPGNGGGCRLPAEWWKTGVAFLYAGGVLVFTTVVITVVHERVPDPESSPPLPDKFFDYVGRRGWAFTVTEGNGLMLVGLWTLQWMLLKHKSIVGRRCFFLIGTLYMYRCVTMYVTTLPVPGRHMVCAPKLYGDSTGKIWRILQLISGGGLSLTGSHLMCGDFLYSGHTVMLTLSYLFIREYSPPWLWWYHWLCWLLSASGVVCILVGHEHYSIDVVVAYFATTRTFWWYHTMANSHELRGAPNNYLSRTWWSPIFTFLEGNVQTRVPLVFLSPLALLSSCRQSYRMVEGGRDE